MSGSQPQPELHEFERELDDHDERLRRQILPEYKRPSDITSQVFKQSDRMPSVYRESILDRDQAREHWIALGKGTAGSCIVTVGEVVSAGARTVDDSRLPDVHDGHAYIDVRGLGSQERDRIAKRLKRVAVARGIEWDPVD